MVFKKLTLNFEIKNVHFIHSFHYHLNVTKINHYDFMNFLCLLTENFLFISVMAYQFKCLMTTHQFHSRKVGSNPANCVSFNENISILSLFI